MRSCSLDDELIVLFVQLVSPISFYFSTSWIQVSFVEYLMLSEVLFEHLAVSGLSKEVACEGELANLIVALTVDFSSGMGFDAGIGKGHGIPLVFKPVLSAPRHIYDNK
jgi:hypothetical protein